jgi:transcriptional regulator with GAF, ATPase, and Fis domain
MISDDVFGRRKAMSAKDKIDIEIFKVVTGAIAQSDNLSTMTTHMSQLLVSALDIKGAAIFVLNPDTEELEVLASSGLSIEYLNKGPLLVSRSLGWPSKKEPAVISDISKTDRLQYPEEAKKEGIVAIVSLPVRFYGKVIGALRLYHGEAWEVSERDLESLNTLAEIIGMAMTYTRLLNALQSVKYTVDDVHGIWLRS